MYHPSTKILLIGKRVFFFDVLVKVEDALQMKQKG